MRFIKKALQQLPVPSRFSLFPETERHCENGSHGKLTTTVDKEQNCGEF